MPRLRSPSFSQGSYHPDAINMKLYLGEFLQSLGAAHALSHSMKKGEYVDLLVDTAFVAADDSFIQQADAVAKTGRISHMYEWGTVGVNRGKSNLRLPLSNPNSRLWSTYNYGKGLNREIGFIYRPSVANVPKPTQGETGMSRNVIESMRDYQFTWKAKVMELGETVYIKPKRRFLLIPATKEVREWGNLRTNDKNRGYILLQNGIEGRPGRKYAGKFSGLWMKFWNGGNAGTMMQELIHAMINEDFIPEVTHPPRTSTTMTVSRYTVREEVARNAEATRKRVNAKARLRYHRRKKKRLAAERKMGAL